MFPQPRTTSPTPGYYWKWPQQPTVAPLWNDWQSLWYSCPHCNKLVQWGNIFCPNCGKKIVEEIDPEDKQDKIIKLLEEILEILKDPHTS